MIRDITIGRYYDSESVIHRMDPRTKLMGVLVYIISLFLVKNVCWYIGCLIVMLVLYKAAGVPFGYLLKGLRGILLLLFFTFLFRMLYTPGNPVVQVWIFTITKQGILKAVQMTARIALMISVHLSFLILQLRKNLRMVWKKRFLDWKKQGFLCMKWRSL